MDIDQQIEALVEDAPQDGRTPALVRAIAPALKQIAQGLRHSHYYLLQSPTDHRWLSTTLQSRSQPQQQKTVIYAFASREDAQGQTNLLELQPPLVNRLPVIPLIFQMVTLTPIASMIFFENPGNPETGTEILRQEVEDLIQEQIQGIRLKSKGGDIPPNFA